MENEARPSVGISAVIRRKRRVWVWLKNTMNEIAVQAENLHKSYVVGATAVGALRGVDLMVRRGEFVALMGPSGCGKTTLLNLLGAIDLPSRGTIQIDGVNLQQLSEDQLADLRRDRIGMVFQFYNLIPTLTACENVEIPMQFKGVGRGEDASER